VFILLPFVLFPAAAVVWRRERLTARWVVAGSIAVALLLPWLAYNYVNLHRFTLSPAGGLGRAVWEGSWQGRWSGRLHNALTHTAEQLGDRPALDAEVARLAAEASADPAPMLEYVHQWQDIRRIWTEPVDPYDRAIARMAADSEYLRVGIANIRQNFVPHLLRRLTRGLFVLWAAEIPLRYSDINEAAPWLVRTFWTIQLLIIGLAAYGFLGLIRVPRWPEAVLVAVPIAYITAVHFPLLTEARQSLPAAPAMLILATAGAAQIAGALKPSAAPASRAGQA
jgi:hypothetical protein